MHMITRRTHQRQIYPRCWSKWGSNQCLEPKKQTYYSHEIGEARLKDLGQVCNVGEQKEAWTEEGAPEQKRLKPVENATKKREEPAQESNRTLSCHGHASSGFDKFWVPHQVKETHFVVFFKSFSVVLTQCQSMYAMIDKSRLAFQKLIRHTTQLVQ